MYHILLVDDRKGFIKQFERYINADNKDFEVTYKAYDGKHALDILRNKENRIDVVISDIRMPIMDGLVLLENCMREGLCPIFVLLSEFSEFEYAKTGLILGAYDYVVKPIKREELISLLGRIKNDLDGASRKEIFAFADKDILQLINCIIFNENRLINYVNSLVEYTMMKEKVCNYNYCCNALLTRMNRELKSRFEYIFPFLNEKYLFRKLDDGLEKEQLINRMQLVQKEINKFNFPLIEEEQEKEVSYQIAIYVLKNITDKELSIPKIAEKFFISNNYLSHIFKQNMGISLVRYITKAKMEYAIVKLQNTNQRVFEIATELGYENVEYFSAVFKKYFGKSPKQVTKTVDYLPQDYEKNYAIRSLSS